jgi:hypothetical protein
MNYLIEPDPTEAAHDGRCPVCGSTDIHFEKDIGMFPVNVMWEGKLCQRVKKSLWSCGACERRFSSNKFFTQ